jgi:hypothetical protein
MTLEFATLENIDAWSVVDQYASMETHIMFSSTWDSSADDIQMDSSRSSRHNSVHEVINNSKGLTF